MSSQDTHLEALEAELKRYNCNVFLNNHLFLFLRRPAFEMKTVISAINTHFLLGRCQSWVYLPPYQNKCNYQLLNPFVTDCTFPKLSLVH